MHRCIDVGAQACVEDHEDSESMTLGGAVPRPKVAAMLQSFTKKLGTRHEANMVEILKEASAIAGKNREQSTEGLRDLYKTALQANQDMQRQLDEFEQFREQVADLETAVTEPQPQWHDCQAEEATQSLARRRLSAQQREENMYR